MPQKKIPTLVGLLLVIFAIVVFSFGVDRVGPLLTKANVSASPTNVMFSNISDTGFTVSWTTKTPATGVITVESASAKLGVVYDERDTTRVSSLNQKNLGVYLTHAVTFRNATANTNYRVIIISNSAQFLDKNNAPHAIRTGSKLAGNGTGIEPAFGTMTTNIGKPAEGALLYLTLENGQTLSTLIKSSGSWVIPLNLVREKTLTAYITPQQRIDETLIIRTNIEETQAASDTLNDNPMPEMILGKSYDFRKVQAHATEEKQLASAPPTVLGTSTTKSIGVIAITKPKDNQALPTNFPIFQGTGIPNNPITLIIGITNPQVGQTIVSADGIWKYTPTAPLSVGRQSVTMTTKDVLNKPVAMTHIFEILKSGTQVLGDATPSATLTPTPVLPTPTDTPVDTATLSGEPIPDTGFPLPLILLLTIGTILITSSGFVLLKSENGIDS